MVTNTKKLIPQGVQDRWHSYRTALKEAEEENLGNNAISEHAEMAGWGVEEAQARHKAEASESPFMPYYSRRAHPVRLTGAFRSGDAAGARLCYSQEFHLRPSASNSGDITQGGENTSVLGMEDRQKKGRPMKRIGRAMLPRPASQVVGKPGRSAGSSGLAVARKFSPTYYHVQDVTGMYDCVRIPIDSLLMQQQPSDLVHRQEREKK